jgi:hypothetical protein
MLQKLKDSKAEVNTTTTTEDAALKALAAKASKMPEKLAVNPVKQALLDAANLIDKEGLVKGIFYACDFGYCVHGAIGKVINGAPPQMGATPRLTKVEDRAISLLEEVIYGGPHSEPKRNTNWTCANWNDYDLRTKEQVVQALRAAAALA